jgi:hypothetical protein
MFFVFHAMPALILSRVHYPIVPVYGKWKLRQIVIVKTITGNLLAPGQLTKVLIHFLQAILKHDQFFGRQIQRFRPQM